MRVVAFTFEAPTRNYGGGLGIIQSMSSLSNFAEVDYVGPFFEIRDFESIYIRNAYYLQDKNGVFTKTMNLVRGVTTRYYQEWKKAVKKIRVEEYDAVFIDFSYNDFIVNWAKENGLKTVVRVHNIEKDMCEAFANSSIHSKYWLRNIINGKKVSEREARVMQSADKLIFLTRKDLDRACELFGEEIKNKSVIVPVCLNKQISDGVNKKEIQIKKPYILTTGVLDSGMNVDGISWFIDNSWKDFVKLDNYLNYSLVIAGRNPNNKLRELVSRSERVILIDTPNDMEPYFQNASLYVAPIFAGAGMKVKVAEALSYGLKVIGSPHALIGYEEARDCTVEASNSEEFLTALCDLLDTNEDVQSRILFEKYYTLDRSINDFEEVFFAL